MAVQERRLTVDEFDRFVDLPQNAERLFEYIGGDVVEVVSNNYSSEIAMRIGARLLVFVEDHDLGRVTGADGGYRVVGERYIPDVAFISKARQPRPSHEAYNTNPPDLAVEVLSPANDPHTMRVKITNYLAAGTVVWVVSPEQERIEVHTPGQPVSILKINDTLDGGDVLPGFTLAVKVIFPD